MKRKPWAIVVIAVFHILAPIGNFILNALNSGRDFSTQWFHWSQILPRYLLFSYAGLPIIAGICIFLCRRWSYWVYLLCIALIATANIYAFWSYQSWSNFVAMLLLLLVDVLIAAYFVVPSVQKVYFDPRLRWWEAAKRYHFNQPAQINGQDALIKNLGPGGIFFKSEQIFNEADGLDIQWVFEDEEVLVHATVVYTNPKTGNGARFDNFSADALEKIKTAIEKLDQRGQIVTERLPGPEDSFSAWLWKLIRTGQGFFPKIKS